MKPAVLPMGVNTLLCLPNESHVVQFSISVQRRVPLHLVRLRTVQVPLAVERGCPLGSHHLRSQSELLMNRLCHLLGSPLLGMVGLHRPMGEQLGQGRIVRQSPPARRVLDKNAESEFWGWWAGLHRVTSRGRGPGWDWAG